MSDFKILTDLEDTYFFGFFKTFVKAPENCEFALIVKEMKYERH